MPVLTYQVNAPGYGGVNPKLVYIFTNDPVSVVTTTGYIDWLANGQGIYTGDVALIVTRQTPTSIFAANFYEFERVGTGPHWNLVPESGGTPPVDSVSGTLNEIIASPTTGNVVVSISPNPIIPGNGSINIPVGNTAQRAGAAGSIRFNSQLSQFEVTLDGINWIALTTGGAGTVSSVTGTTNEIVASPTTGNVIVSIANNPVLPGTAEVVLPTGTTGQRGSTAGGLRFNTQLSEIELTNDGTNWYPVSTGNDTVNSVSGTAHRITVTGTDNVVVDIANDYIGQTSITTLGTVTTGTWDATPVTVPFGGTGSTSFVANAPVCEGSTTTSPLVSASTGLSNSGWVLTSNGSAATPSFQPIAFPGGQVTSLTLTATQIDSVYATPIQLLAAQGANTLIVVETVVFEYLYDSTFTGGPSTGILLQYNNAAHGAGPQIALMNVNMVGTATSFVKTIPSPGTAGIPTSTMINKGVYISNTGSAFTGGGNGQIRTTIYYAVLTSTIVS